MTAPAVLDPPAVVPPVTPPATPPGVVPASIPEAWTPPENKEAFDKAINDAVAAESAKYKAPEKYEGLKLPDEVTVDPTLVERTAAIARTLGLSQDKAQGLVDSVASEVATQVAAHEEAIAKVYEVGSPQMEAEYGANMAALLSDPEIGNGKPEILEAQLKGINQVAATYFPKAFCEFLDTRHPTARNLDFIKGMARIHAAMSERPLISGTQKVTDERLPTAKVFYGDNPGRTEEEIKAAAQK